MSQNTRNTTADETADDTQLHTAEQSGPMPWALGGEAPGPAKFADAKVVDAKAGAKINTAATHTGTDPLGRAVGPKEDHREIKKVRDPDTGRVVTPKADGTLPDAKGKR